MDWLALRNKSTAFAKKYRYVLLVLALGLLLMALPEGSTEEATPETAPEQTASQPDLQSSLEEILAKIDGAGKVSVLLTVAEGEKTIYQTDQSTSTDSVRVETVIITDSAKAQQGLVRQVDPPLYLGAVVVCQGGDNPAVRLAIVEAVSSATGLGADKISVLKMK